MPSEVSQSGIFFIFVILKSFVGRIAVRYFCVSQKGLTSLRLTCHLSPGPVYMAVLLTLIRYIHGKG